MGQVIRGRARRVSSWSMRGMPLEILRRRKPSSLYPTASISLIRFLGRRGRAGFGASCGCWAVCLAALALLFAVALFALWRLHCCLLCLPCRACIAARCFCVTAGQGATSNAIALEVVSRRRICLALPPPAAHGLLSLFRLLRAFLLHVIKRNHGSDSECWYSTTDRRRAGGWRVCYWGDDENAARRRDVQLRD